MPGADVVRAAVGHYVRSHEPVVESWLAELTGTSLGDELAFLRCVAAIERKIVEIAVTAHTDCTGLSAPVWRLAGSGWHVLCLVPAASMGEAHAALRGAPCQLQPWWLAGGDVAFGRCETP
jgi:hypothetical protein